MGNDNLEQVSTLVDGELDGAQLRHALDSLRDDAEQAERWTRYHLISDALRNNLADTVDENLHQRVWDALEDEPTVLAPRRHRPFHVPALMRQAAGLAVAASVTAVAILGVQSMNRSGGEGGAEQVATVPATTTLNRDLAQVDAAPTTPANTPQPLWNDQQKAVGLDTYLVNHNEYSGSSGVHGVLPYVRIVSYGNE